MKTEELEKILESHKKWLNNAGGERAYLNNVDLQYADLSGVDLQYADLSGVDLQYARLNNVDLSGACLSGANLQHTYLNNVKLRNTDLSGACLSGACLSGADLRGADLGETDLRGAYLCGADLSDVNIDYSCVPLRCGGLKWKTDKRLMAQIAYHFCSMECEDEEVKESQNALLKLANQFHRVKECGVLKEKEIGKEEIIYENKKEIDSKDSI